MAACSFGSAIVCLFMLKEPEGAFSEEYHMSSVDLQIEKEMAGSRK